ncbi:hypothetical protein PanWU01x14_347110, partial [Parasponia andersonii]
MNVEGEIVAFTEEFRCHTLLSLSYARVQVSGSASNHAAERHGKTLGWPRVNLAG